MSSGCRIRLFVESDRGFVFHSWLKSFKNSHYAGVIPMHHYYKVYTEALNDILSREGTEVVVATNPEESDARHEIFGWCCAERGPGHPPVLHYIYMKQAFRHNGIAKEMLQATGILDAPEFWYTFRTLSWSEIVRHNPRAWHKPLFARFPKTASEEAA